MVKCPFCHFQNEEGALFCEQCKSDLGAVEPVRPVPEIAEASYVPAAEPVEPAAYATIPESVPVMSAAVVEATVQASPPGSHVPFSAMETVPLSAVPIAEMATPFVSESPTAGAAVMEAAPLEATLPEFPVSASPMHSFAEATVPTPSASPLSPPTTPMSPAPVTQPAFAPSEAAPLPPDAQPRLLVLRGLKRNVEYPLYDGHNFIGRADEKPVDIDLEDQEPPDRIWSSRQHALITYENGRLAVEDLNSSNGTFVNRARIYPGQKRNLGVNDVIQIGTVQMKVIV